MKSIFCGSLAVFALVAVTVSATNLKNYKVDELELANNVIRICGGELNGLMKDGYTTIVDAKMVSGRTRTGSSTNWTLTLSRHYPLPSGLQQRFTVNANELMKLNDNNAPDAPGFNIESKCTVTEIK